LWRGAVERAIKGDRGQRLIMEMRDVLDAMPVKRLIAESLVQSDGEVCAMGAVAKARGVDVSQIDPEDRLAVAKVFNIAPALAAEIAFINDDDYSWGQATPEQRWQRVRNWTEKVLRRTPL
jgi:hypothetical protein